ncbi:hypothetical protein [Nostoc sp.]|uniref:hypothetical protein n=1 Tax=Nostoc sp. TaxID=1180 RepID=UPI002FFADDCA
MIPLKNLKQIHPLSLSAQKQVGSKIELRVSIGDEKKPGAGLPACLPREWPELDFSAMT